ncbi:MAG: MBL fold metallo-hydrolase [Asgard group archaeon]|nr:MBL fold metallo-hydrolase [Asgard group archaeon]
MGFEQVNDNIYVEIDEDFYDAVVGAIVLPNKLVMIDTGTNIPKIKAFKEKVEKKTGKKFEILFITHRHGDHYLANHLFSDCRIIAHQNVYNEIKADKEALTPELYERLKSRFSDPHALDGLDFTLPNEIVNDEITIRDDDVSITFKVTGGHSACSAYIYSPELKVLFAGDNLFAGYYPYGGDDSSNGDMWIDALEEYLALDVGFIMPGHGLPCDKEEVKKNLEFYKNMKKTMIDLHNKCLSKDEILKQCYNFDYIAIDETIDHDVMLKNSTLKRFYAVWIEGEK